MIAGLSRLLVTTKAYGAWWRLMRSYHLGRGRRYARAIMRERANAAWVVHWAKWAGEVFVLPQARPIGTKVVVAVGPSGGRPTMVLKLPTTRVANQTLARQCRGLAAIHADPNLGEWRRVVPVPLGEGTSTGQRFYLEQALPGNTAHERLAAFSRAWLLRHAAGAIRELHRQSASTVMVDSTVVEQWVREPLRRIRCAAEARCGADYHEGEFELVASELTRALSGRLLQVSRVHGDFWLGNVLMDPDTGAITGVIDWDRSGTGELPAIDLVHLLLITRLYATSDGAFGEIVQSFLNGAGWREDEAQMLEGSELPFSLDDEVGQRLLVVLCWIRRTSRGLESCEYELDRTWFDRNVGAVLAEFTAGASTRIVEDTRT